MSAPTSGRLVIHIGLHKTGTTFLQNALHRHRAALAGCGLVYPPPGAGLEVSGGTAHHFLAHAVLRHRLGHTPDADFDRLGDHVAALRAASAAVPGATAVISSEDFSLFRRAQVRRLRALFPDEEVRILVYLRRQDRWLEALYGQVLKQGRHLPLGTFLARNRRRIDYAGLLAPWAEAFGPEKLILRAYEGFEAGGLWADFCTALDRQQAVPLVSDRAHLNVSLSREASTFLTLIRNERWRHRLRRFLERSQRRQVRPGLSYLSPALAREIMAGQRSGNHRLAQRYLGRAQLFRDEAPLPAQVRPPRPVRRVLVFWQLLVGLGRELAERLVSRWRQG